MTPVKYGALQLGVATEQLGHIAVIIVAIVRDEAAEYLHTDNGKYVVKHLKVCHLSQKK